jgi:hypothetical protein
MPRTKANFQENNYVTAAVLRKVVTSMIPFYRKVAYSSNFSNKWAFITMSYFEKAFYKTGRLSIILGRPAYHRRNGYYNRIRRR